MSRERDRLPIFQCGHYVGDEHKLCMKLALSYGGRHFELDGERRHTHREPGELTPELGGKR